MPSHPCVLENCFIANIIHAVEKKRFIFLHICGHDTYCLGCDLFLRAPEEVSLSEILQVLLDHLLCLKSQSLLNVLGSTNGSSVMQRPSWCILLIYRNYESIVHLGIL